MLARLPVARVRFIADTAGVVRTDTRSLGLTADVGIEDLAAADVLVVPGGPGDEAVRRNGHLLDWIPAIDTTTTWTTSVCTGSLIVGAAGLLRGRKATSHFLRLDALGEFGAQPVRKRVVVDGKIVTAAGVSAGIDMALRLAQTIADDDVAQAIQLGIEYDPQPPFDAGSPAKAPARIVDLVKMALAQTGTPRPL